MNAYGKNHVLMLIQLEASLEPTCGYLGTLPAGSQMCLRLRMRLPVLWEPKFALSSKFPDIPRIKAAGGKRIAIRYLHI